MISFVCCSLLKFGASFWSVLPRFQYFILTHIISWMCGLTNQVVVYAYLCSHVRNDAMKFHRWIPANSCLTDSFQFLDPQQLKLSQVDTRSLVSNIACRDNIYRFRRSRKLNLNNVKFLFWLWFTFYECHRYRKLLDIYSILQNRIIYLCFNVTTISWSFNKMEASLDFQTSLNHPTSFMLCD